MNLAIVVPSMRVGGTERQVVELVRGLAQAGEPPVVALLDPAGELLGDLRQAGVDLVDLGGPGVRRLLLQAHRLDRLVKRRPDTVVYTFLSPANFLASLHHVVSRRHHVVWGIRDDRIGAERGPVGRRVARLLTGVLSRQARGVIVNGTAVQRALVAFGIDADRIRVVPNAIDQTRFAPDPAVRAEVRAELGLEADVPVVLSLARMAPKKRHHDGIAAFAAVVAELPSAQMLLAGSGDAAYVASLRDHAAGLGIGDNVRMLGERGDPERLFNAADVTLLMSEAEGFPNSVAESLSTGTPCVATRVGDIPNLLPPEDVVAVGDVAAASAALRRHLVAPAPVRTSLLPPVYGRTQLVDNTLAALRSLCGHDPADGATAYD